MELLVKYIAGEASPEEAMAAEEWIQATPENKQQFEALQQVWTATAPSGRVYQQPDVEHEWNAVRQAVTQTPVRNIKARRFTSMLVAASVVVLAGILGWFLLQQNSKDEVVTLLAQTMQQKKLPDQTVLTLDANSRVTYAKDFDKDARELTLEGEGFFQVTHNPQRPFIIDMDGVKLQVLGTSFRVNNNQAAQMVEVEVATGKVMLYN
ncbi:MAG TPA: FecR domain-containing protein, partial [Flavisolibacter sp.]|nr:FecR domain-containing protein [Flavisolibacter sp.]